jgi:hypothetical protein
LWQSRRANGSPDVHREAAEELDVFGHVAHVELKERKALLDRRKLLKELFLGGLVFPQTGFVFVLSIDKVHMILLWLGKYTNRKVMLAPAGIAGARQPVVCRLASRSGDHATTKAGLRTTGRDKL